MAFLILFSSLGFTVYAHECKITHIKEFSSSEIDPCCPSKLSSNSNEITLKKTPCCKLTKEFKKVATSQQIHLSNHAFFSQFYINSTCNFSFKSSFALNFKFEEFVFQSNAPPLPTSTRLAILQRFLI